MMDSDKARKALDQKFQNMHSAIYMYGSHMNTVPRGWICHRHMHHRMLELNLVMEGSQAAVIGEKKVEQNAGDLLLVSPMQIHEFSVPVSRTMQYFVVHIQLEDSGFLNLLEQANQGYYPKDHGLSRKLQPLLIDLYESLRANSSNLAVTTRLFMMMNVIEERLRADSAQANENGDSAVPSLIAKEIEKRVLAPNGVMDMGADWMADIARGLGFSRRHAYRVFQKAYGLAPREYYSILRQQEAMQMLANTEESVERIAHRIGYENVQSFSRQFVKWTGLTPSSFRQENHYQLNYLTPLER